MPLTYEQFDTLSPSTVVKRLVNRHQHYLALKV